MNKRLEKNYKVQEVNFLTSVIMMTTKDNISISSIYNEFVKFCNKTKNSEISLLRYGEVIIRSFIDITTINDTNSITYIKSILNSLDSLDIPIVVVMIGAISKLGTEYKEGDLN